MNRSIRGKEVRDTNKSSDLFECDDGIVYVLIKTPLGWLAVAIQDGSTFGGLQRTMSQAIDGLEPLGYSLDMKEGKRWEE